ncbi:GNAT family N-acetyltransferase [Carboxylicivirga sp. RSCT41]|uniref:GNAT family N-acetyltransferase n=1 Tax=Carboxylicivirga agarovorans TaxID=3417570 RepID=UPI003D32A739
MKTYTYTNAGTAKELSQLVTLFNKVFAPEKVGELAQILTDHFPGFSFPDWYIVKDESTGSVVSGFASIPWQWQFEGIPLKVAELGILGTDDDHRNKGLFKANNEHFEHDLKAQDYDLAVIQGIPGIYHRLGYYYSLPMENHTEVPLYAIQDHLPIDMREANSDDIPFLVEEERQFNRTYNISSVRTAEHWQYILSHGKKSEYGSRIFIITNQGKKYYIRILDGGFGTGVHVSEASISMPADTQRATFSYLKEEAARLEKSHIRLNLPEDHPFVKTAGAYGATIRPSYAWQIKIIDFGRFIGKIKQVLERRIQNSSFAGITAITSINCYQFQINIHWKNGMIHDINTDQSDEATYTMSIPGQLLTQLLLGYRTWQEMQYINPDVFPADQYLRFSCHQPSEISGQFFTALFPKLSNWVNCQY